MIDPTCPRRALAFAALAFAAASLALVASCSTRPNPAFCCSDPADCSRFGVTDEKRDCAEGSTCVGNTCVHACADAADCDATEPVCEGNLCRKCVLDAECQSGACADDGTCVPEADVVYLAPQGVDLAPCSQVSPCKELRFAIEQTSNERSHIVLSPGIYQLKRSPLITPTVTSANRLIVHGNGATLDLSTADALIQIQAPATLRDLYIVNPFNVGVLVESDVHIERSTIRARPGIMNRNRTSLRDVQIRATGTGIFLAGGDLTIDGATITGGITAIADDNQSVTGVDIVNLLVYGTSDVALDLDNSIGSLKFTTIASSGSNSSTASGLTCASIYVQSTIIWTPGSTQPPLVGGCSRSATIAGPIAVSDAMNLDPRFISAAAENFRLAAGSPARDLVDSGPSHDLDGDPRPQGSRFDIGAYESP